VLDGATYIHVPSGIEIMGQPQQIAESLAEVVVTDDLRKELKDASPHVRLIHNRVKERIRRNYSPEDEIKLLRTAPVKKYEDGKLIDIEYAAETVVYNEYVEDCRAWGRAEKAKIGL